MLGWLWLALPALVLLLLLAPIDMVLDARLDERGLEKSARLRWLGLERALGASRAGETPAAAKPRPNLLAMLRTDGFLDAISRAFRRLRRATRVVAFRSRARLGLGDPAATGEMMGLLAAVFAFVPLSARPEVTPDFDEERVEGELHARVRIRPLRVLGALLALVLTPAVWRAAKAGRRA